MHKGIRMNPLRRKRLRHQPSFRLNPRYSGLDFSSSFATRIRTMDKLPFDSGQQSWPKKHSLMPRGRLGMPKLDGTEASVYGLFQRPRSEPALSLMFSNKRPKLGTLLLGLLRCILYRLTEGSKLRPLQVVSPRSILSRAQNDSLTSLRM